MNVDPQYYGPEDVTLDDVNTRARNLFRQGQTLAVVGPFEALPA